MGWRDAFEQHKCLLLRDLLAPLASCSYFLKWHSGVIGQKLFRKAAADRGQIRAAMGICA